MLLTDTIPAASRNGDYLMCAPRGSTLRAKGTQEDRIPRLVPAQLGPITLAADLTRQWAAKVGSGPKTVERVAEIVFRSPRELRHRPVTDVDPVHAGKNATLARHRAPHIPETVDGQLPEHCG